MANWCDGVAGLKRVVRCGRLRNLGILRSLGIRRTSRERGELRIASTCS